MSTADKLNALVQTKADIKQALIDKGQNPTDVFSTYADDIRAIETGGVIGFETIGYTGNEEPIKSNLEYSKSIMDNWDASITDRKQAYANDLQLRYFPLVDFSNVTNANQMFYNFSSKLELVPKLDTSNVTDMFGMFKGCKRLEEVPQLDYSKVTTVESMFEQCTNLKRIGYIDCSNNKRITTCIKQTAIDYNPFINTEGVTDMYQVFSSLNCSELDLSTFSTESATNMRMMFSYSKFDKLDLSGFDTSNVTNMTYMFQNLGNENCELIFPDNFGCNCTDMSSMFSSSTILYIPKFDSSKATECASIFNGTKVIKVEEFSANSLINLNQYTLVGYSLNSSIRFLLLKGIGTSTYSGSSIRFNYLSNWGVEDETIELSTGARQSMIDTLITYSYDRVANGRDAVTLGLSDKTKALLTEEEIAQITAKGYTIE